MLEFGPFRVDVARRKVLRAGAGSVASDYAWDSDPDQRAVTAETEVTAHAPTLFVRRF